MNNSSDGDWPEGYGPAHLPGKDFDDLARDDGDEAVRAALDAAAFVGPGPDLASKAVTVEDFYAHMPSHSYIFVPTREFWPASSVNARIRPVGDEGGKSLAAAAWLDRNRPVEQMTWAPGEPLLIGDRIVSEGGWIDRPGCSCFNLYRPPSPESRGDASQAHRWIDHAQRVYPGDAEHIINWLAHRVQRPHEKINHALVLGGAQGIGKDTILEPVKQAIGPWNFSEVSPQHMQGRFNGFLKSVILRVSEARDLGDADRFAFYDHMKTYTAAPPDVLRVDEKHRQEYAIFNVCGVIITSNHKSDGIYLPSDDRRHFIAWSDLSKDDFDDAYWRELWGWYASGGQSHVAAYLRAVDLSGFDAKAPPRKTEAFWSIVDSNRAPEDAELADALDRLGNPSSVTLASISSATTSDSFSAYLRERKNSRTIKYRLEDCGYEAVRNRNAKDGLWVVSGERKVIYARKDLSVRDRIIAAEILIAAMQPRR